MKMNKKLISLLAVLALLVALGCGAIIAAAAETALVKLSFASMEDGLTEIKVSLNGTEKPVDYVQLNFDPMDVAETPSKYESAVDNVDVYTGSNTVLAIPVATGVSMADGTTVFTFQVENTANGDVLNYSGSYILCYTDGTSAEGSFSASITVKGNLTSRLEAETDSIYWRYQNNTEAGVSNGNYAVGGIQPGTAANMQSFEALAGGTALKKTEHPMVSFIVDVPVTGEYTLSVTYRGNVPNDYFIVIDVDDTAYTKSSYVSAHPDNSAYHITGATVSLTAGRHTIRLLTMLADTSSVSWVNIDCMDVKGPGKVTAVAPQWTHLQSWNATYKNKFTAAAAGTTYAGVADWYGEMLGGYQGDGSAASAGIEAGDIITADNISSMGYFAYTVHVPADGFYDLQTYIMCYKDTTISSKQRTGHIMLQVDDEKTLWFPAEYGYSALKWNAQNLSCYLTAGTHTLVVSGIVGTDYGTCSKGWCDMGALSVSGGITIEGVTQIKPLSISITKTGNTLLLESMVQNKYQFSVEGVTLAANENNSGLLVWRGEKLAAANGVYEFGTQSYVVNNLSAVDGTIKALGIAAKEQGDDIVARGFVMDANGKYYYSELIDFKATTYASAVFADNAATSLVLARPTVAAMLNYFGKAQKLFDHTGNGYMDEIQIPAGIDLTYDASYRIALEATPEHFTSDTYTETFYHSLELEDNVYIKYIVPRGSKTSAPTLLIWEQGEAITLDNATQMPMGVNGSYYTASITGIAPKDMGKTFFVSIYDATTGKYSQLDAYSIHQYAGNMITKYAEDASQAELVDLCKALLTYSHMAKNYFASLNADVVYVSNAGTAYNSGATAADATDWETALYKVKDGGTLYMVNYAMREDNWPAHTKSVTLQGSLDASALTTLNIKGPTTFGDITLTVADGAEIYANGNKVTVSGDVKFSEMATAPYIFGGGNNGTTVANTDLTVLTGTWSAIYGGGSGAAGSANYSHVTGTAKLVVGGNVNATIDETDHDLNHNIYGGSRRGKIGTTNVSIGGSAKANYTYGGGSGTNSGDWCDFGVSNITITDNAAVMSVCGGNRYGGGQSGAITNVTIDGGAIEQVIGGSEHAALNGTVNVTLNGGVIDRRVIGGCYNNWTLTDGWKTEYYVTGTVNLTINSGATVNCSSSYSDHGIIACSRHGTNHDAEIANIYYENDTVKANYASKLGLFTITSGNACDND